MSRTKIFLMLFLTFLVGTGSMLGIFQHIMGEHHRDILGPEVGKSLGAARAGRQLFALQMMDNTSRYARQKMLIKAFQDADKKGKVYVQLAGIKAEKDVKAASVVLAVDNKGFAFARSGDDYASWKGADWKKQMVVQRALKGFASHGIINFEGEPHIFVSAPVVAPRLPPPPKPKPAEEDEDQAKKKKKKNKCGPGKRYLCWFPCLKRDKKRKCLKKSKKQRCGCLRDRRKRKPKKVVKKKAPEPKKEEVKVPTAKKEKGKSEERLGVLLTGYKLDRFLVQSIQNITAAGVAFVDSKSNKIYSTSLNGRVRDAFKTALTSDAAVKTALTSGAKTQKPFSVNLAGKPFMGVAGDIIPGSPTRVVILKSVSPHEDLFSLFIQLTVAVGVVLFLLALVLLFIGTTRFQNQLERIEEQLVGAYNSETYDVSFNENAPWLAGPLAATLNRFFRQLRGEPDPEDEYEYPSGPASWEGLAAVAGEETMAAIASNYDLDSVSPKRESPWDGDGGEGADAAQAEVNAAELAALAEREAAEKAAAEEAARNAAAEAAAAEAAAQKEEQLLSLVEEVLNDPETHYQEVYSAYRDAKEQVGDDTSKLNETRFIDKLRKNASSCIQKYDCRGVIFEVSVKDNKVILKPQLIPKED